ncbi:MAG: FMN-binding protein [Oscillospiraceae bacterium]|nr:FMN-binding protein [Oscillospiraceae bacterium]
MKEKIMPPLVLAVISVVVCGLLVVANALTKDKIVQAQIEKTSQTLSETFGEADYTQLDINLNEIIYNDEKEHFPKHMIYEYPYADINAVYTGGGKTIFDITADGYAKAGINVLVGFENDSVCGIGFLSLAETPGLGTKVQENKSFTEQFLGASDKSYDFEVITGATYSSNGMEKAVDTALTAYYYCKEGGYINE